MNNPELPQTTQPVNQPFPLNQSFFNKNLKIILIFGGLFLVILILLLTVLLGQTTSIKQQSSPEPSVLSIPSSPNPTRKLSKIVELTLNKEVDITSTISAILLENTIPSNCADCISLTRLVVSNAAEKADLNFTCGGFTGRCTTHQSALGVNFDIIEASRSDSIKIQVTN
jgi:hypothetical protein